MNCSRLVRALCCSIALAFASHSFAASTLYDESVGGDVSNDPTAPTQINAVVGTNSFVGAMNGPDVDFFTIHVPAGAVLSSIFNPVYNSLDQVSFIAIGPGTSMPAATLSNYDPTGLLGYTHFGPGVFDPADDLLVALSAPAFGVPGFTPPLPAGAYTFWLQQESGVDESYQIDFKVDAVPEPGCMALIALGCVGALGWRRGRG
jgi:hypothetical protein